MTRPPRPRWHFTPRRGWINDPYGLTWHAGRYHLFFQQVPEQTGWSLAQHWGHAVSDDLLHWTELEPVLSPGDGDEGVWSGSVAGGYAFYTSVRAGGADVGTVRMAHPRDDEWATWDKGSTVVVAPSGLDLAHFRDPSVARDGAQWRMVVGAGAEGGSAMALSWVSEDLFTWVYDGVLAARSSSATEPRTGAVWECPQLLRVGEDWVLVVSVWADGEGHYEAAAVGALADGRFHPRAWHRLTYGAPYAGSAFVDRDGRPCLVHWLRGVRGDGWAGAHSVAHVVAVDGDRAVVRPHPAVAEHAVGLAPSGSRVIGDVLLRHLGRAVVAGVPGEAGERFWLPCADDPVQVLVDGPVIEVFGSQGVAAMVDASSLE